MSKLEKPTVDRLDERVCVVTGATAGIGHAGATAVAQLGAEVVLVGRSGRRLVAAERDVRRAAPSAKVRHFIADFASLASVRSLAHDLRAALPRIHVLINNAGVFTRERSETLDGFETQFGVNHLAPFLLTNLLIDHLADSAPSRVVTVASQVERSGRIDFDDLQGERRYDGLTAYRQSKLANILFTRELARRVAGRGIDTIALHPGVYTTRLLDNYNGWSRLVTRFRDRGLPDPSQAGGVLALAASSSAFDGANAMYLHETNVASPSLQAHDDDLARRLWDLSARLTGVGM